MRRARKRPKRSLGGLAGRLGGRIGKGGRARRGGFSARARGPGSRLFLRLGGAGRFGCRAKLPEQEKAARPKDQGQPRKDGNRGAGGSLALNLGGFWLRAR